MCASFDLLPRCASSRNRVAPRVGDAAGPYDLDIDHPAPWSPSLATIIMAVFVSFAEFIITIRTFRVSSRMSSSLPAGRALSREHRRWLGETLHRPGTHVFEVDCRVPGRGRSSSSAAIDENLTVLGGGAEARG